MKDKIIFAIAALAAAGTFADETVVHKAALSEPRDRNVNQSGEYAPSSVQTQLRVDVKEADGAVRFIRDNSDPYVLTKVYRLKNADPYAVRGYLLTAVTGVKTSTSPVSVDAIRFNDGKGILLVSAEDYRFLPDGGGESIDEIVEKLDQPGLHTWSGKPRYVYYPKFQTAANLREMLVNVGGSFKDREFANGIDMIQVDAPLNALFFSTPHWSRTAIEDRLAEYDRPIPELRLTYKVIEVSSENDERIGADFQTWKKENASLALSAGYRPRDNFATTFEGGIERTDTRRTRFVNLSPKWSTRYLDFLSATGRARTVTDGVIVAQNGQTARVVSESGLFRVADGADVKGDGFRFELETTPTIGLKAAEVPITIVSTSLSGWDTDGKPRLAKSETRTVVSVGLDGQDFAVGGVTRSEAVRSSGGVPVLKSLPWVGRVFATESESVKTSELVVLVTAEYSAPADAYVYASTNTKGETNE